MLLKDKVVVVSGIGPGLGMKLAVHAAREGASGIVVSARRAESLDQAEEAVAGTGAKCAVLKQVNDIRDEAACKQLVAAAVERFGGIDGLINNAVASGPATFVMDADYDDWHIPYDTNVVGTLKLSRAVVEQMKEQTAGGAIVMVNTMGAKAVSRIPHHGYLTSKAALAFATKALAIEVGRFNIRVNSLHPGWMWGATTDAFIRHNAAKWGGEDKARAEVDGLVALPRAATDEEVADATLFLVSDYARAITGASLDANAGEFMP
jgi:NAD(P)-dependent dehydrogenase (short-subunit alcohol dehydrogenase family)